MRVLIMLAVLAVIVALVVNWLGRPRRPALPAPDGQPAMLAAGTEQGPGRLRLTATQLVFTAESGRVLVIERLDIVGASTTRELPDQHVAAPVLVVRTETDVHYILVANPEDWVRALT